MKPHMLEWLPGWGLHLIRLGLLFILAGLTLSTLLRHEETVVLELGETARLEAGIALELLDTREVFGNDGRVRNWVSTLRIQVPGGEPWIGSSSVNKPLRISPYRLYQTDWERRDAVQFAALPAEATGNQYPVEPVLLAAGEGYRDGELLWVLTRDDPDGPTDPDQPADDQFFFLGYGSSGVADRRSLQEGGRAIGLRPQYIDKKIISGMRLSYDPGALPSGLGALLLSAGVILLGIDRYKSADMSNPAIIQVAAGVAAGAAGLLTAALFVSGSTAGLVPALRSPWLILHVGATLAGVAFFLFGAGAAVVSLLSGVNARRRARSSGAGTLSNPAGKALAPDASSGADRYFKISFTAITIGYPLFTLGALVFGGVWAFRAWGRYWAWDPKEVWALVTWLVYTLYLHLRLVGGSRGWILNWLAIAGMLLVGGTLFGVIAVFTSLHAY